MTVPASCVWNPAIKSMSVDLPDPLGPYSATMSPAVIVSDNPSIARTSSVADVEMLDQALDMQHRQLGSAAARRWWSCR